MKEKSQEASAEMHEVHSARGEKTGSHAPARGGGGGLQMTKYKEVLQHRLLNTKRERKKNRFIFLITWLLMGAGEIAQVACNNLQLCTCGHTHTHILTQ